MYTFTTPKLQPLVTKAEGKNLIQVRDCEDAPFFEPPPFSQSPALRRNEARREPKPHLSTWTRLLTRALLLQACLNAPEPTPGNENGVDGADQVDSPEESTPQHMPPQGGRPGLPQNPHMPAGNYMPPNMPMDPQQALAYQNYVQQRNQGYGSGMPQAGMPPNNHHQS